MDLCAPATCGYSPAASKPESPAPGPNPRSQADLHSHAFGEAIQPVPATPEVHHPAMAPSSSRSGMRLQSCKIRREKGKTCRSAATVNQFIRSRRQLPHRRGQFVVKNIQIMLQSALCIIQYTPKGAGEIIVNQANRDLRQPKIRPDTPAAKAAAEMHIPFPSAEACASHSHDGL